MKKIVFLTRKEHFNAAHCLYNEKWPEEKNREVFGKCANKNFHGHNYTLYVTVKGTPDPDTGFIMNAAELGKLIKLHIVEPLDHKNLNLDVDFIQGLIPSTENIVIAVWKQLEPHITGGKLHCIKLCETENIYVEYYGPEQK